MIKNENNENDSNNEESSNIIKKNLALNEDEYTIKIYSSKDSISIVFKLVPDKLQTYYFYEKFDLRDFKQKKANDLTLMRAFKKYSLLSKHL
jgi:hypothetical protein